MRADQRTSQDWVGDLPVSLTSVPALSLSAIDGRCGDKRSEAIYLGRRRVSFMVAALCLMLAWGRSRHLNHLLAQGAGDQAVGIAILGDTLLLGILAFVAAAAMMSAVLGFPRLIVTLQGLTRRSLFRTTTLNWNSLSRFHLQRSDNGRPVSATADIVGPNASPGLRRDKGKLFKIADAYRMHVETIVAEIHNRQTEAMGNPAQLSHAASIPVVPQYGVPGFRMPWTTFGLIALLTAVFVAEHRQAIGPELAPLTPNLLTLYAFGGLDRDAVFEHGQLLRLFSSTLLHFNKTHLIGNVTALLLVGWPLERLVGRSWLLGNFVASSFVGSVVGLAVYPAYVLVGASGGIAGLFGAMVVLSFRLPAGRKRTFTFVRTTLVLIVMLIPSEAQGHVQIGHAIHFVGALAGAALGILLLRRWNASCRLPEFRRAGLAAGTGGLALALLGIPTSLHLSREFIASVQGCVGNDPDTRIRSCTVLLDSGANGKFTTLLNRGNAYAARKQYDLAIVDFDRLVALAPGSAYAFVARGYAYAGKGLHSQSIPDFTKAIELDPKLPMAYLDRGGEYLNQGLVDLAIADEDQAIALDPKLAGAYALRGNAYRQKGEAEEAISDYSKAIALNPGDADAYFNRSVEHLRGNHFDEAIADQGCSTL